MGDAGNRGNRFDIEREKQRKENKMGRRPSDPESLLKKRVFTTGEAAKLLHVSQMSVIKWFNEGKLEGYRVPYSKDRRITRESLVRFVRENNLPFPEILALQKSVLVVDDDPSMRSAIEVIFEDMHDFVVEQASTGYEAGLKMARLEPDLVILDIMLSDMDARTLVKKIREDERLKHAKVLGISAFFKEEDKEELKEAGFDDFLPKPFTAKDLKEKVASLLHIGR